MTTIARQSFARIGCTAAQAVEQVGDKWTLAMLRSAFHGMTRFDEIIPSHYGRLK